MYPTTGYTPSIDSKKLETHKFNTHVDVWGREHAVLIAKERIEYLLEIGHSETAHALQSMLEHGQEMLDG